MDFAPPRGSMVQQHLEAEKNPRDPDCTGRHEPPAQRRRHPPGQPGRGPDVEPPGDERQLGEGGRKGGGAQHRLQLRPLRRVGGWVRAERAQRETATGVL